MLRVPRLLHHLVQLTCTLLTLLVDAARFLCALSALPRRRSPQKTSFCANSSPCIRNATSRHGAPPTATRLALVWLGRWFDWRQALAVVQPETFLRWHRQGFRLFWRWKSTPGRPPIPADLQALIRQMARENPTWGQERIANELLLKLGLRVSPRTVRKYMPKRLDHGRGHTRDLPTLADLCAQSCPGDRGL